MSPPRKGFPELSDLKLVSRIILPLFPSECLSQLIYKVVEATSLVIRRSRTPPAPVLPSQYLAAFPDEEMGWLLLPEGRRQDIEKIHSRKVAKVQNYPFLCQLKERRRKMGKARALDAGALDSSIPRAGLEVGAGVLQIDQGETRGPEARFPGMAFLRNLEV